MATSGFNFGTAWIQIAPSLRGLDREITQQVQKASVKSLGREMGLDFTKSLGQGMAQARKHISDAQAPLRDFVAGFRDARAAQSAFTGGFGTLGGQTRKALDPVMKQVAAVTGSFVNGFTDSQVAASALSGTAGTLGGKLRTTLQPGLDAISRMREGFNNSSVAASTFSGRAGTLGGMLRTAIQPGINAVTSLRDGFGTLSSRLAPIGREIGGIFTASASSVSSVFSAVQSVVGGAMSAVGGSLSAVGGQLASFGNNAVAAGQQLDVGLAQPALIAATAITTLVGVLGFKRLVGIDTARGQFEGLGLDADAVMAQVDAGVTNTSLSMAQGASAAVGILATGSMPLEDLEEQIKRVANVSAAYNVDAEQAAYLLNNVLTKNQVTWGDLSQMQMNQIPVVTALADHYGIAAGEIMGMAQAGQISIEDLNAALDSKAGAAAESYAGTWAGITANITANIGRIGAKLMEPSFDILKERAAALLELLKSPEFGEWAEKMGIAAGGALENGISLFQQLVGWFQNLSPEAQRTIGIIAGIAVAIGPVLVTIGKIAIAVGGAISTIGGFASAIGAAAAEGGSLAKVFSVLGGPVGIVLGVITALIAASPELRAALGGVLTQIGEAIGGLLAQLAPVFQQLMSSIGPLLSQLGAAIAPLVEVIGPLLEPVFEIVSALLGVIIQIVSPLLDIAAAILGLGLEALGSLISTVVVPAVQWLADILGVAVDWFLSLFDSSSEASQGMQSAWEGVTGFFQGIWDGVAAVFTWIWESILQPIVQAIAAAVDFWIVQPFTAMWNVISFVWEAVSTATQIMWAAMSLIFQAIVTWVQNTLGPIFTWLYENIIKPVWDGISGFIGSAWTVISGIFTSIKTSLENTLGPVFNWLYNNVIKPVWDNIRGAIDVVWGWFNNTLVPGFQSTTGWIGDAFESLKKTIDDVWKGIKEAAVAPINFVINTVYNDGIKALFDSIAEGVGLDIRMPKGEPIKLATGGVLPGYTPGRDVHKFSSPTGGQLWLSGGEGIIRPDALRALGGKAWLDRVNGAKSRAGETHFADGGMFDWVGDAWNNVTNFVGDVVDNIGAVISDPLGAIDRIIMEPVRNWIAGIGGGFLGEAIGGWPIDMVKKLGEWFRGKVDGMFSSGSEGGGYDAVPGPDGGITYQGFHGGLAMKRLIPVMKKYGLNVTSTWDTPARNAALGRRKNTYHADWANPAVDMAGSQSSMFAAANEIRNMGGWRQILWQVAGHYDHIHVAKNGGVFGDLPRLYDDGGWLQPGLTLAYNATGAPEPVLTSEQWKSMREGGNGVTINQTNYMPTADPNVIGDRLAAKVPRRLVGVR